MFINARSSTIAILAIIVLNIQTGLTIPLESDDDPVERRWQEFKTKYNKSYSSSDAEQIAFENFMENLRKVVNHNANSRQYRMDINHMSDWSDADYQKLNNFVKPTTNPISRDNPLEESIKGELQAPSSVDYRDDKRLVGPVKDQGACGACWAFATVGLLEGQQRLNSTGYVVSLSEQNLIDCDRAGENRGCAGGNYEDALAFIKANGGLETDRDYPYKSASGSDKYDCKFKREDAFITTMYLTGSQRLVSGNELSLMENVARYGPVAVSIDASLDGFRHYKSGIFYDERCSSTNINHAVLIVGYGTNEYGEDYWIVKNSWSTQWGLNGYALMARNRQNHCGIASYAVLSLSKRP